MFTFYLLQLTFCKTKFKYNIHNFIYTVYLYMYILYIWLLYINLYYRVWLVFVY